MTMNKQWLGRLLLAACLMLGGAAQAKGGDEQVRVDAYTASVEGASQQNITEVNKLADIFRLQKQLVYKLLQTIGINQSQLAPAVRQAIDRPHTTSIQAFKAFSNCLDLMDKGQYVEARKQCDEAVKNDPQFALAINLRAAIPDRAQSMPEIVADHLNRPDDVIQNVAREPIVINTIPLDTAPVQTPVDIGGQDCQGAGGGNCASIEIDRSRPACDQQGSCGFYATFLAREDRPGGPRDVSAPYLNRVAVAIPPTNPTGAISINQLGYEGQGHLDMKLSEEGQSLQITSFQDAQAGQGGKVAGAEPLTKGDEVYHYTGLELGYYAKSFDFSKLNPQGNHGLLTGTVYYAEGQATPMDTVKNLGRVPYEGVAIGDFSVNGSVVPCQGGCGTVSATLNYAASRLEHFDLQAQAESASVESPLRAAARITADNVAIKPSGEFEFGQATSGASFKVGTTMDNLSPATGGVAGRPFGPNAESVGGIFAIHGGNITGQGAFGGARKP